MNKLTCILIIIFTFFSIKFTFASDNMNKKEITISINLPYDYKDQIVSEKDVHLIIEIANKTNDKTITFNFDYIDYNLLDKHIKNEMSGIFFTLTDSLNEMVFHELILGQPSLHHITQYDTNSLNKKKKKDFGGRKKKITLIDILPNTTIYKLVTANWIKTHSELLKLKACLKAFIKKEKNEIISIDSNELTLDLRR